MREGGPKGDSARAKRVPTLLDADEGALKAARKMFSVYGRTASYIKANVIDSPPEDLMHEFDIVISGGLVELFSRQDRDKIILYHKLLMKSDGFVYVRVPKRSSLFYQTVVIIRRIVGLWTSDTEIPFTPWELKKLRRKLGFLTIWLWETFRWQMIFPNTQLRSVP